MARIATKRLQKELADLMRSPPAGVSLVQGDDLQKWIVRIDGAKGSLYDGETFQLQFKFPNDYPIDAPEVIFLNPVPIHPHIYSNGHICLSILYNGWTPALTTTSVCLSLQSMLSSCTGKAKPPDDSTYVARVKNSSPKNSNWVFHDDKV
ncbi:ubiquitin-conjugating enzyme E2 W [Sorochytrium milnesiophthora]